jgi:hypothetical protein
MSLSRIAQTFDALMSLARHRLVDSNSTAS